MEYTERQQINHVFEIKKWKFNKWAMKSTKEFHDHIERYKKLRGIK